MRITSLVILAALSSPACGAKQPTHPPGELAGDPRVVLQRESPFLMCEGHSLFATVMVSWNSSDPAPATSPPAIHWASADTTVATMNAYDEVTGRKAGSTYLVATTRWGDVVSRTTFPVKVLKGDIDPAATRREHRLVCGRPPTPRPR
jgi:hypothetical protein